MPRFLNILLQKSDPNLSWGFHIVGGREYGLPLTIYEVSSNSFSSQYLSKGDEIIQIEGIDASLFTEAEALSFIKKPSKSLDLVIFKRPQNPTNEFIPSRCGDLNLKSGSCDKKSTRKLAKEKRNIYKRSNSVPPKPFSIVPQTTEFIHNSDTAELRRLNSVRDQSASPTFWRTTTNRRVDDGIRNTRNFWKQMENGISDAECDSEVAKYCRSLKSHWQRSSSTDSNFACDSVSVGSTENVIITRTTKETETCKEYRYKMPVQFDYYENQERQHNRDRMRNQGQRREKDQTNISRVYLSPYDLEMQTKILKSLEPLRRDSRRQTSQTGDNSPPVQPPCESAPLPVPNNCNNGAPPAPAPPPPPPPVMNGSIPTIRLKSEISDRCEPPAKIQNAMLKDKKPFTYTPGGIDLSEIKSPRMQRRIVRNAQTPEDVILPTTTTVHTNALPPSAIAAMTPQIAIAVFPQNGIPKKSSPNPQPKQMQPPPPPPEKQQIPRTVTVNSQPQLRQVQSPPPPPEKQQIPRTVTVNSQQLRQMQSPPPPPEKQQIPRTIVVNSQIQQNSQEKPKEQPRVQVGSIYIPPITEPVQSKPAFPTLREAPTPWLQKHQQPQEENKPTWLNRNKNNGEAEQKEVIYERKPRVQQVQEIVEPEKPATGTRVIPIQIDGASQTVNQPNSRQNSQRWGTEGGNQTVLNQNNVNRGGLTSNKSYSEPDSKPIQSRSFKVIQRITGSEDDTTDFNSNVPYNTEGLPLSQLRKLQLREDDQAFMNKVKSQEIGHKGGTVSIVEIKNGDLDVDEDIFLHTETDPRYRGSAIPSRAFRMLQNMTESGQVIPTTIEVQAQARPKPAEATNTNEAPQRKYIPPSERQAEQELRKYMGSSIPSRSFRMLQAMTATQDTKNIECTDNIGEEMHIPYPNPWPNPPKSIEEANLFWIHYMYLFNLVLEHLPNKIDPDIGDFWHEYSRVRNQPEIIVTDDENNVQTFVSNVHRDECSENESNDNGIKDELIITEIIKDGSEPDVSLTVCIPLRRKSIPIEYHEEVTIRSRDVSPALPADNTDSIGSREEETERSPEKLDTCDREELGSPNLDLNANSDTEHSDSSSVDFWKEIADDEDISFKHRPITPFEKAKSDQEYESDEAEENQTNKTEPWELGEDIKNYCNYTKMDSESSDGSESNIDPPTDDDSNDDSSDENDSYNVYEFSTAFRPAEEPATEKKNQETEYINHDTPQTDYSSHLQPNQNNTLQTPHQESDAEDSGMTSDQGKCNSEAEQSGSELRKLSKYQRANTHSRLLRILQDEEKKEGKSDLAVRKESLTLPLRTALPAESVSSSSGINSPMSPVVNEKLVNELVQSLLKCKGTSFRKLSPEKLREAAIKSLQAEFSDATSGTSSPYLSDRTKETRDSQATDSNYTDYYDSCDDNSFCYPGFDILPSRAFRILQSGRTTPMNWPKCPLVSNQSPDDPLPKLNNTQDASYKR